MNTKRVNTKNGLEFAISTIVMMMLALVVLVVVIALIVSRADSTKKSLSSLTPSEGQRQIISCKAFAGQGTDIDQDSSPDYCDICLGGSNSQDTDHDSMPDACDRKPSQKDSSLLAACCGTEPEGKTLAEMQKSCPQLLENDEYFRCKST